MATKAAASVQGRLFETVELATAMDLTNGHDHAHAATRVELQDKIVIETRLQDKSPDSPVEQYEFEVVGIVEDAESDAQYAVCYSEGADEFIVTNETGELIDDDTLAQEILGDFLDQASDADEEDNP